MKKVLIVISLFFLSILFFFIYILSNEDKSNWLDYVSVIGTIASIYGIVLTLIQVSTISSRTQQIRKELKKKSEQTSRLLSYGELEKQEQMLKNFPLYINTQQYALIHFLLTDTQKELMVIHENSDIDDNQKKDIARLLQNIGYDLGAINDKWLENIDFKHDMVIQHVNAIIIFMQRISSKLRNQGIN